MQEFRDPCGRAAASRCFEHHLSFFKEILFAMVGQADAILVQNAAGLGFMLRAAGGRTQHQPSTRSILNQNRGLLRQHAKVVL